ncbi:MAG: serine/threonine-protein kinase [Phycisphaerae bacterium]
MHGSGGFASVIKGRDNQLERDVAVKVLNPSEAEFGDAERERFRREARILAKLSHPNIPSVYDVDFSESQLALVCQFIDGLTLRQVIDNEGPCDLGDARRWFTQICSALDHAHGLGVIHRDIKPANIIITPNRESAYLVDFGIALAADDARRVTESGYFIGTPGYMSPEQQAGDRVDAVTDLYSLGVTLYEALSGKRVPTGKYEEIAASNEAIPPEIDDLIQDCLKDRPHRISTPREFASRLAGALKPQLPLSDVLAHGRLHEVAAALEELSADELPKLPEGQRALIMLKLDDIVTSGDPQLEFACARFLELLIPRGIYLDENAFQAIIAPAVEWGYERNIAGRLGRDGIRRELILAAAKVRGAAHRILRGQIESFLRNTKLADKEDWYLHSIRELLQTLLANPTCGEGSRDLAALLMDVNRVQRSRR